MYPQYSMHRKDQINGDEVPGTGEGDKRKQHSDRSSPKRREISRRNGAKSKGPKSTAGKQRVRLNAIGDALYAKDVVVEKAGENFEEFNRVRDRMLKIFRPEPMAEIFFDDFMQNWWRRQRVRRAETLSLQRDPSNLRARLERMNEVQRCSFRLSDLLVRMTLEMSSDPLSLISELEDCRVQLSRSSEGLAELQRIFKSVELDVHRTGKLSRRTYIILGACFGFNSDFSAACINVGSLETTNAPSQQTANNSGSFNGPAKIEKQESTPFPTSDTRGQDSKSRTVKDINGETNRATELSKMVRQGSKLLGSSRLLLSRIEEREATVNRAARRVAPDAGADRYSRAETMYERRMHRAFMLYAAAQKLAAPGIEIPELPA